ncbi:MAG: 4'-phosphopantetheinyl transferase superfamily protein [Planctomycetes bacterium]|nr:4'-phosphopantetheinyl transferase superfamily protein [Planctomycetota bacterium]
MSHSSIDIWDINCDDINIDHSLNILNKQELERHKRLLIKDKKNEFAVSRACLRQLLAKRLSCATQDIEFHIRQDGKPEIQGSDVQFNVSHSQMRSLIAISEDCCGIDLEYKRKVDYLGIAKRFFHPDEWKNLTEVEPGELAHTFFRCWSRKEASMKCSGRGMQTGSSSFCVSINDDARILIGNADISQNWSMQDLDIDTCYTASVVSTSSIDNVKIHSFRECASFG